MTDERRPVVAGVDTHKDTHYAAVISVTGEHLAAAEFPATQAGYQALQWFITCHGVLVRAGVEGTNSYGAGLSHHLHDAGVQILEVIRSSRQIQRMRGKSDEIDAYAAAHIALAATNTITANTGTGNIEAIRVIHAARRSALKSRTEAIVQLKSLPMTAPEHTRADYRDLTRHPSRPSPSRLTRPTGNSQVAARTRTALKRLAARYQQLDEEIAAHDSDLTQLIETVNPALVQTKGIATITAAQLLITAGDNPERIASKAAFAMLCGAAPIPASSGRTTRHRLNRGGDTAANSALHRIALVRLATDPDTRAHAAKRKSKKDILRCLKRAIAREVFHLIAHPQPVQSTADLRPARRQPGLTITDVANALGYGITKIPRIERGHIRDTRFLHEYHDWLTSQQPLRIAV